MSAALETQYRRLLRWYPLRWREQHAAVTLGTLMDAAEFEGRHRPTTRESFSLMGHGLGVRLDVRSGLAFAVAGTSAAILAGLFQLNPTTETWITPVVMGLQIFVAPTLIAVALAALMRELGVFSPISALWLGVPVVVSTGCAFTAVLLWAEGFAAAERGIESAGTGSLLVFMLSIAWVP